MSRFFARRLPGRRREGCSAPRSARWCVDLLAVNEVVVAIDDVQWLDPSSSAVIELGFVVFAISV